MMGSWCEIKNSKKKRLKANQAMATETTSKLFNKMSRLRSIIGDYIRNLIKIVSDTLLPWSWDWVLIGKSASRAKLMRNL